MMTLGWAEISTWESTRIDDAASTYRHVLSTVVDVRRSLENAMNGLVSQGEAADAMRQRLSDYIRLVDGYAQVIEGLISATIRASEGVAQVRSEVEAAIRLADQFGLVIAADGSVSTGASWTASTFATSVQSAVEDAHKIGLVGNAIQAAMDKAVDVDSTYATAMNVQDEEQWCAEDLPLWGLASLAGPVGLLGLGVAAGGGWLTDKRGDQTPWWQRKTRRGARDGRRNQHSAGGYGSGEPNKPGGLGQPVKGQCIPIPKITPWQYPGDSENEGSGKHGQRSAGLGDYFMHELATSAADIMAPMWPDAAKNLSHYLDNTGTPADIDVDRMLEDLPEFKADSELAIDSTKAQAIQAAKDSGTTEPVIYPFTTEWKGHYAEEADDPNWFFATGGFHYATAGTVTVYPPDETSSEWRSEVDYKVHVADRYNWDGSKSTQIGPITVDDKQLQEFHKAGIAKEFDLVGESEVKSR